MDKWLKRVNIDTLLQIKGKTWHTKLNGVTRVTKSQTGGKKWNSLFKFSLIGLFWTLLCGHFGLFSICSQVGETLYFYKMIITLLVLITHKTNT